MDGEYRGRMGFVLISGNFKDMGKVLKLNNKLASLVSFNKGELIGKPVGILMPPSFQPHHNKVLPNYILASSSKAQDKLNEKTKAKKVDWHMTQTDKIHYFYSKLGCLVPLVCNFDMFFD